VVVLALAAGVIVWLVARGNDDASRNPTSARAVSAQQLAAVQARVRHPGRSVPREVSIVGFDDIPEAQFFTPPLTTVRQDFNEMGRQSLMLLLGEIGAPHRSSSRVVVEAQLRIRESTAPPR
jgi:DNA-binding LacI/PurR family transcriptional regulator